MQHINLGHCTSWQAREIPKGYEVDAISYPGEDAAVVVNSFIEKIKSTVETKSLDENNYLKVKGNIVVTWNSDYHTVALLIDGQTISLDRFGEMLSMYEGWQIQYRIEDSCNSILRKDELFLPVKVGHDVLLQELERSILATEDSNNFIKYSDTTVFEILFEAISDKLELMLNSEDYADEGIITAKGIIKRLEELETDDDYFPYNLIEGIKSMIVEDE